MKAVVVEIRGNKAALLSDDGCVVKVKNENYEIGQEVSFNMKKNISIKKKIAYFAASIAVVVGVGAATYYVPTTYVSMDVNPSIEYHVNMFDKVVSVKGVNEDGSNIIENVNESTKLENKSIEEAIRLTVNEVAKEGYLDYDNSGIVIATSTGDEEKAEDLAESLEDTANEACEDNDCDTTVEAEPVGKTRVEEARKLGVTPGKLNLVQKLIKSSEDPDNVELESWLNKPVKDIMAKIHENKGQNVKKEKNKNEEKHGKTDDIRDTTEDTTHDNKANVSKNNGKSNDIKGNSERTNESENNSNYNSENLDNSAGTENSKNAENAQGKFNTGNENNKSNLGSDSARGKMGNK